MVGCQQWEMADCCVAVHKYDQRTPGLFKDEFKGSGIISLNSKTYYCWSDDDDDSKYRSKGLSKKQNTLTRQQFMSVLTDKVKVNGTNKGFVFKDGSMFTYSQQRSGLTYMYAKRHVLSDGISTSPLSI